MTGFIKTSKALAVSGTSFIHVDFENSKKLLAWKRGLDGGADQAVVVANFSNFGTPGPFNPAAEYLEKNWPATSAGKSWKEITIDR